VKALASQTATATEEISGQIRAIQDTTRDAVAAIERIGATISKISEISTAVSSAVEQQDATTREMAHNVTTVAQSTSVVSEKVAGLANAAGETGQAADMVRDHAGELKHQADALRIQVDQFLTRVRAPDGLNRARSQPRSRTSCCCADPPEATVKTAQPMPPIRQRRSRFEPTGSNPASIHPAINPEAVLVPILKILIALAASKRGIAMTLVNDARQ
jgi:hypothetical protein